MVWDETVRIVNGFFDTAWGNREVVVVDDCLADITLPVRSPMKTAQAKLTPTVHCFRINPVKISLGIISAAGELYCDTRKTLSKSFIEVSGKDLMIQLQFPRAIR